MNSHHNINGEENDPILSQMLAEKIQQARKAKNPSAEDLVEKVPLTKVVFK